MNRPKYIFVFSGIKFYFYFKNFLTISGYSFTGFKLECDPRKQSPLLESYCADLMISSTCFLKSVSFPMHMMQVSVLSCSCRNPSTYFFVSFYFCFASSWKENSPWKICLRLRQKRYWELKARLFWKRYLTNLSIFFSACHTVHCCNNCFALVSLA